MSNVDLAVFVLIQHIQSTTIHQVWARFAVLADSVSYISRVKSIEWMPCYY